MITLIDKIKAIYPELGDSDFLPEGEIRLQNDGDEDYIAEWNHPSLACPTQEQLNFAGGSVLTL